MNTSFRVHPQTNKFPILFHDTHHGHQQKKVHFMMAEKIFACKFEIFCWKPTFLSEFFLCICEKSGNFYSHGKWKTFFPFLFLLCSKLVFYVAALFYSSSFYGDRVFTFLYDLQCEKRKRIICKVCINAEKSFFFGLICTWLYGINFVCWNLHMGLL